MLGGVRERLHGERTSAVKAASTVGVSLVPHAGDKHVVVFFMRSADDSVVVKLVAAEVSFDLAGPMEVWVFPTFRTAYIQG